MQSLRESLDVNESAITNKFWKWVDDMGGYKVLDLFDIKKPNDYTKFYEKVESIGTSLKDFEKYVEEFFTLAMNLQDELLDEDFDGNNFSDDGLEYASWGSIWYGEKKYKDMFKNHYIEDNGEVGELTGYAMDADEYEDYLNNK